MHTMYNFNLTRKQALIAELKGIKVALTNGGGNEASIQALANAKN